MPLKVPAGADVLVILFDINTSARQEALSFLAKVLYLKQLSGSKDICEVYLFNTSNGITPLDVSEMKVNAVVEEIQQNYDIGKDSFIEAIQVATDTLREYYGSVAVNLQTLLITDFANCKNDNKKISGDLVDALNEHDIFLYIIGPNIRPNKMLLNEKDLVAWKKTIPEEKDNFNLNQAIDLVKRTKKGIISDYELGFHLFNSYKYDKGMQPWNVPLAIGSKLELPVSTLRMTKEEAPFKLSTFGRAAEIPKWVFEDEEDKEADPADMISGIMRHGKFIKIETDNMFKSDNPRSFSLLGFTDQVNIPEYYFQSDATYMVVPDLAQPEEHTELFSTLVDELAKAKLYGVARRVYYNNCEPKFVAMVPRPDMKVKCFLMFELPYADDVAYGYEEEPVTSAPKVVKDEDIYKFLDGVNITSTKCKAPAGLGPLLMLDPSCVDTIKKVEEKIFEMQHEFDKKELNPSQEEEKLFENVSNSWPKREIVKIEKDINNPNNFDDDLDDFTFDD